MSYVRPHPQNGDSMARSMIRGLGDPCVAVTRMQTRSNARSIS